MTDTRKGFTLVELLAVIVILAIIMIIAIPSVLGTMTTARQKSFCEYVSKVYQAGQNQYLTDVNNGSYKGKAITGKDNNNHDATWYVYNITTDLGLSSTGSYKGYVAVRKASKENDNKTQVFVLLEDNEYITTDKDGNAGWLEYTATGFGEPKPDDLMDKGSSSVDTVAKLDNSNDAVAAIKKARTAHEGTVTTAAV